MDTPLTALKMLFPANKRSLVTYMLLGQNILVQVPLFFPFALPVLRKRYWQATHEVQQRAWRDCQKVSWAEPPRTNEWATHLHWLVLGGHAGPPNSKLPFQPCYFWKAVVFEKPRSTEDIFATNYGPLRRKALHAWGSHMQASELIYAAPGRLCLGGLPLRGRFSLQTL